MPEGNTGVQDQPRNEEAYVNRSWGEIRAAYASTPYPEYCDAVVKRAEDWRKQPRVKVDETEWNKTIAAQVAKGRSLPQTQPLEHAKWVWDGKLFAMGEQRPALGKSIMTRVYIGVDPRKAVDAYEALIGELQQSDVLKDIDAALNIEEVERRNLAMNTIILYEPGTRSEVLSKMLEAYRNAKQKAPDAFALSPHQRATLTESNIRQFKAIVDANMAFVEMDPSELGRSYDADVVGPIRQAFGITTDQMLNSTPNEYVSLIKTPRKSNVVYDYATREKLATGKVQPGDNMRYLRKLSAPALIQPGSITVNAA